MPIPRVQQRLNCELQEQLAWLIFHCHLECSPGHQRWVALRWCTRCALTHAAPLMGRCSGCAEEHKARLKAEAEAEHATRRLTVAQEQMAEYAQQREHEAGSLLGEVQALHMALSSAASAANFGLISWHWPWQQHLPRYRCALRPVI